MTTAGRPFNARLLHLRQGDGWSYAVFDCRDPRVLRDDPVLERLWDNPYDAVFDEDADDQRRPDR